MRRKAIVLIVVAAVTGVTGDVGLTAAENIDPCDDGSQYAYGENVGWLNFEPVYGPGVTVTDEKLTGFVWAANVGWINLDPNFAGVANDGTGLLSGFAWGENIGWINFNPKVPDDDTHYGVTINGDGNFDGFAWGENIGWIHFRSASAPSYKVQTSWITSCLVGFDDLEELSRQWLLQIGRTPVGHWRFDEGWGGTAVDSGSGENDGMLVGDPQWTSGRIGDYAVDLDGSGDYVRTEDVTTGLDFAPNSFSVSAWVRARQVSGGWRTVLEYNRYGTNWFGLWLNQSGRFHFRVGYNTKDSEQILNPDEWHLLTGTYEAATKRMSLYVDEQFDSSAVQSAGRFSTPVRAKLTIGVRQWEDAEYFDGMIDDVRVYAGALSAAEVAALSSGSLGDIDGDGGVDLVDYSRLAELWLELCPPGWSLN